MENLTTKPTITPKGTAENNSATLNYIPPSGRSSLVASPIVMTNADYKRPSSSVSVQSFSKIEDYAGLPRSICGTTFLFCHFLIAIMLILASLIDLILNGFGVIKPQIRTVSGIPPIVAFLLSAFIFVCIALTIKIPIVILFGSSKAFKSHCYKKHTLLMLGSIGMIFGGLLCLLVHLWLASRPIPEKFASYLPGGMFLILHGLMSFRLFWELQNGVDEGGVIMLPYCVQENDHGEETADFDNAEV